MGNVFAGRYDACRILSLSCVPPSPRNYASLARSDALSLAQAAHEQRKQRSARRDSQHRVVSDAPKLKKKKSITRREENSRRDASPTLGHDRDRGGSDYDGVDDVVHPGRRRRRVDDAPPVPRRLSGGARDNERRATPCAAVAATRARAAGATRRWETTASEPSGSGSGSSDDDDDGDAMRDACVYGTKQGGRVVGEV